jgi:6-phosphogluconolactonase
MDKKIYTCTDSDDLARTSASYIASLAREAVSLRGRCTLMLSGGETPKATYRAMSSEDISERIPWEQILLFWGDERFVPHTDSASNYNMARQTLIDRVPVPEENIFPVPTDQKNTAEAALLYQETMKQVFIEGDLDYSGRAPFPILDLVLLGIGEDGHTVSIFDLSQDVPGETRWVIPSEAGPAHAVRERVSITMPLINSARNAVFLIAGQRKQQVLQKVIYRSEGAIPEIPAQLVQPRDNLVIMTDIAYRDF